MPGMTSINGKVIYEYFEFCEQIELFRTRDDVTIVIQLYSNQNPSRYFGIVLKFRCLKRDNHLYSWFSSIMSIAWSMGGT